MAESRRIGVLTFHRCVNYGSYWQARAMVGGLRALGESAVLLDHRDRATEQAELRNAFQPVRPRRMARSDLPALASKTRKFRRAAQDLPRSAPFDLEHPAAMEPCDVVLIGGDEVWNFRHPWYSGRPLFFGDGLRADKIVSYAASFGAHEGGLSEPWRSYLARLDALSVRDHPSQRLVRENLGWAPPIVLDPCLQFPETCRSAERGPDRVAIVYGHDFPEAFIQQIRRWSHARSVRLVSLGYRNDWAHAQRLDTGPDEFIQALGSAEAVVTNFFHGCVLALVHEKPFVTTLSDYRRNKIVSLMKLIGGEERLVEGAPTQMRVDHALDHPPEAAILARLADLRRASAAWLADVLR